MQKENVRKHGPVVTWKMTEEERQAYINQHPIVYREELKPKLIVCQRQIKKHRSRRSSAN